MQAEQDSSDSELHETELEVRNSDGLHMRPAMRFVDIANGFDSDISVSNGETNVDGKKFTLYNDTVIAFGSDGKEIFRTQVLRELVQDPQFDEPTPK